MNTKNAVANRIIQLCNEKNIAINALANISGISPSTLYSVLNEKSQNPGIVTIKKLCDGLDISLRDIQMLHVRLDAYFAHLGMKHETEVEAVVVGNVGGVSHFSFPEERELQNDFIDMRIEIPVLDFARDDDFALWGRRWFLSLPGVASEEQKQGKDKDG